MRLVVEARRGGLLESEHAVAVALVGEDDAPVEGLCADAARPVFWRSAAKFFQALPLVESGAADCFGLSASELSLACGSHSGAAEHVAGAAAILRKIGASADDLHCGPHPPLDEAEARLLAARGEAPTRLHNNCSGKHAGMLAVCRQRGWPLQDYNRLHHPLQQEILAAMAAVTGEPAAAIGTAVDGCGAVVFRTPLLAMARAFRRFGASALPAPHRAAGERILAALRAAPAMMAGRGRLCTAILEVSGGRLVGKVGAEGVYGLAVAAPRGGEIGRGLAIKVVDGAGRAAGPALLRLCRELRWLDDEELGRLRTFWDVPLHNHQGERVGEIVAEREGCS